jgi:hypothetical protein
MTADPHGLSPDDTRILGLESAVLTGHTLKLIVLSPGAPLDLDRLRASVEARLPSQPRARERVDTADAREPRWVPDDDFDITQHVRRRVGTECTTDDELRLTVSALMSEHLDRSRPLWTLDLIGPLADGREAIAARLHHAMVDGIAGIRFLESILLDPHDAPTHSAGGRPAAPRLSPLDELRRMPAALERELGRPGGRSPFDKPVTSARELSFTAIPLTGLRDIGSARPAHATVNDVLLAVVAGGLRDWLGGSATSSRHRPVPDLRAQIPVSLHHRDEGSTELGNRDSFINVDLALHETDPLRRLDHISAQTRTEKQLDDAALLYDLLHALGRFGPAGEWANRIASDPHEFSVAVSNVPGPRVPVSVAGRPVERLFSSSEPGARHALRIAAISDADTMGIGFCTDPTALPGISSLAAATEAAYAALRTATT